jgi:hypothetical protein
MTRANATLKANVDAILKARGQTREDLSKWCRREVSWASKILNDPNRWFPNPYLDRVADFCGLQVYQLFQPGISPLTERRVRDRRTGKDRRMRGVSHHVRETVSQMVATMTEQDIATLIRLRALSPPDREEVEKSIRELPRERKRGPRTSNADGGAQT